jgi:hypothetical protein
MSKKKIQRERSIIQTFYADFDLLPRKYKEMLWEQNSPPITADVVAAWDLATQDPECNTIQSLLDKVNCLPKAKKPDYSKSFNTRSLKPRYEQRTTFWPSVANVGKNSRLIARIFSEAELEEKMAKRRQASDIQMPYTRTVLRQEIVKIIPKKEDTAAPEKPMKQASTFKMLHNAGGRKV